MTLPFGKYQGLPLNEVPDRYLEWAATLANLDSDLEYAIGEELLGRAIDRLIRCLEEAPLLSSETLVLLRKHLPACARRGVSRARLTRLRRAINRLEKACDAAD